MTETEQISKLLAHLTAVKKDHPHWMTETELMAQFSAGIRLMQEPDPETCPACERFLNRGRICRPCQAKGNSHGND